MRTLVRGAPHHFESDDGLAERYQLPQHGIQFVHQGCHLPFLHRAILPRVAKRVATSGQQLCAGGYDANE